MAIFGTLFGCCLDGIALGWKFDTPGTAGPSRGSQLLRHHVIVVIIIIIIARIILVFGNLSSLTVGESFVLSIDSGITVACDTDQIITCCLLGSVTDGDLVELVLVAGRHYSSVPS